MDLTTVSDCPTPTVSTMMMSKPAASHSTMVSRVLRATPPSVRPEGEGRMKALGSVESSSMRVLSPRMLPLDRSLLGSMARTAIFLPMLVKCLPKASMKVLLPTPGTPVMPMRSECPAWGRHRSMTSCAIRWWSVFRLSASVMARLRMTRSPFRMPST